LRAHRCWPGAGKGEREAIALAREVGATLLLIDDLRGRREATKAGLQITCTLGLLVAASQAGLCNLPDEVGKLREVGFFVADGLLDEMLRQL